jgi:hypothetical protein
MAPQVHENAERHPRGMRGRGMAMDGEVIPQELRVRGADGGRGECENSIIVRPRSSNPKQRPFK